MASVAVTSRAPAIRTTHPVRARVARVLLGLWLPAGLVALWYVTSLGSENLYYPPQSEIWQALIDDWTGEHFAGDVVPSLACLFAGLTASVLLGVAGGYALGVCRPARQVLLPILDGFRSTPAIALIPVFIAIFGIGSSSEIFIIVWVSVWPILLNTVDGISGIERGYHDVARVVRLTGMRRFGLMSFPAASPQIMAGINTSIGLAVTVMVALEMYSSQRGIGFQLVGAQRNFDLASSYAGAIVAGILGYALAVGFHLVQRRVLRWHVAQRAVDNTNDSKAMVRP